MEPILILPFLLWHKNQRMNLWRIKKAYVLTLGNPDVSSPDILYVGDRGVLQVTVYRNAYLEEEIAYYGAVLPPVVFQGSSSFDGLRSILRFGTMVEATEEDDEIPFRIASLETVRKKKGCIYQSYVFGGLFLNE